MNKLHIVIYLSISKHIYGNIYNLRFTWVPFPAPGGPKRMALIPLFSSMPIFGWSAALGAI